MTNSAIVTCIYCVLIITVSAWIKPALSPTTSAKRRLLIQSSLVKNAGPRKYRKYESRLFGYNQNIEEQDQQDYIDIEIVSPSETESALTSRQTDVSIKSSIQSIIDNPFNLILSVKDFVQRSVQNITAFLQKESSEDSLMKESDSEKSYRVISQQRLKRQRQQEEQEYYIRNEIDNIFSGGGLAGSMVSSFLKAASSTWVKSTSGWQEDVLLVQEAVTLRLYSSKDCTDFFGNEEIESIYPTSSMFSTTIASGFPIRQVSLVYQVTTQKGEFDGSRSGVVKVIAALPQNDNAIVDISNLIVTLGNGKTVDLTKAPIQMPYQKGFIIDVA
jgi:hypothetical protein